MPPDDPHEQRVPIYVISLARAPDRLASIAAHLHNLGLHFQVWEAVDGALLPEDELKQLLAPGVDFVPGVVGCYKSHIAVYEDIVAADCDVALVLEDDARLNPDVVRLIRDGPAFLDFDLCLLDSDDVTEGMPVFFDVNSRRFLTDGFPVYETNLPPALLHAYLITKEGAKKRTANAWPIFKPIDVHTHLPYKPRVLVCVSPKGASVSEHSRQSFTSDRHDTAPLRLRFLRRFSWFFRLREWLTLRPIKGLVLAQRLKRTGMLRRDCTWRRMPTGRNIH